MTSRMRRILLGGLLLAVPSGLAIVGVFSWVLVRGPRMEVQPSLRTYEASVPLPPEGSLPQEDPFRRQKDVPPDGGEGSQRRGEVYYGYYCRFCHGENGAGHGPVGVSYMPVPADLRSERIQGYSGERLRRAMLEGRGHEPVLERVVRPDRLDDLAAHVRSLGERGKTGDRRREIEDGR